MREFGRNKRDTSSAGALVSTEDSSWSPGEGPGCSGAGGNTLEGKKKKVLR